MLIQAFERRVLTYNPANAPACQVQMGNIGQHYYEWRYGTALAAARPANGDPSTKPVPPTPVPPTPVPPPSLQRAEFRGRGDMGAEPWASAPTPNCWAM